MPLIARTAGIEEHLGALAITFPDEATAAAPTGLPPPARLNLATVTVDRARLASTVAERSESGFERLAHTDPLTGLANLRTVSRVLELELARAGRQGSEVSVALFDIDGFAALNAEAGRDAGDDLLRSVASILAGSVRLVDTVARFGADEFVLVAPGSAGADGRRAGAGRRGWARRRERSTGLGDGRSRPLPDGRNGPESVIAAAQAALERARLEQPGRVETTDA